MRQFFGIVLLLLAVDLAAIYMVSNEAALQFQVIDGKFDVQAAKKGSVLGKVMPWVVFGVFAAAGIALLVWDSGKSGAKPRQTHDDLPGLLSGILCCGNCDQPLYADVTPEGILYQCKTQSGNPLITCEICQALEEDALRFTATIFDAYVACLQEQHTVPAGKIDGGQEGFFDAAQNNVLLGLKGKSAPWPGDRTSLEEQIQAARAVQAAPLENLREMLLQLNARIWLWFEPNGVGRAGVIDRGRFKIQIGDRVFRISPEGAAYLPKELRESIQCSPPAPPRTSITRSPTPP